MLKWFENRISAFPSEIPDKPPENFLGFCWHFADGSKFWLIFMSFTAFAIALLEISFFGFLGSIVDWLTNSSRENFFSEQAGGLIFMVIVLLVIFPILGLLNTFVIHQVLILNLEQRIRWQIHRYLLRQSMNFFQNEFAGRISTKLMQTSMAVREVLMRVMDISVYVLTYFLGTIVFAFVNDWQLALPFIVWLLAYVATVSFFVPRMAKVAAEQADTRSLMTGRVVDSYTNIATVKLFSHAKREEDYALSSMRDLRSVIVRQMRYNSGIEMVSDVLGLIALVVLGGYAIWLWSTGVIEAGAVAASIALMLRVNAMSHWVMWEVTQLFENIGIVRDGIKTISVSRTVEDDPDAKAMQPVKGNVAFKNVSFAYERSLANDEAKQPAVIENLDLVIKPGEKIGLVGPSGAGKSTIVNMLLRFYDLKSGKIEIDGQDIAHVTQESLRAQIGVVSQDTSLLHRSIRDNIVYGRPDASEAEMRHAAKISEAETFIGDLQDSQGRRGYDAHVGERGVKLSGGQRQRIAIARVLLKDAPILILDEATSALDSEVEAAIQQQLQHLMQGKTVIAIAHRLSTIAAMDRLIVLDKGKIVEQGSHDSLLQNGQTYARLWERQSGGFLQTEHPAA